VKQTPGLCKPTLSVSLGFSVVNQEKRIMDLPECQELLLSAEHGVLSVTLNRPHKRNAMNSQMVDELRAVFSTIEADRSMRAVVLKGTDGNFCAGGDISGMNDHGDDQITKAQAIWNFNRSFGHMVTQINHAPQVVIAVLEGAVLGGGLGLACVADVAIVDVNAKMGMPETGLGIIPAQIAPFVVARIGLSEARRLALLGDWVKGEEACRLGIAHYATNGPDQMGQLLAGVLKRLHRAAPGANALTKKLLLEVGVSEHEVLLDRAADYFAHALESDEGQEGTKAFVEKRLPNWAKG
jgi:isohexenylglutaconyl-CoA hydratase